MNQNDRQTLLNMGYDALKGLAAALKISDRDISYQGALSIAFGARGSGNAEPFPVAAPEIQRGFSSHPEIRPHAPGEQVTLDMLARQEKPSVMERLAVAKKVAGGSATERQVSGKQDKSHDAEL